MIGESICQIWVKLETQITPKSVTEAVQCDYFISSLDSSKDSVELRPVSNFGSIFDEWYTNYHFLFISTYVSV